MIFNQRIACTRIIRHQSHFEHEAMYQFGVIGENDAGKLKLLASISGHSYAELGE